MEGNPATAWVFDLVDVVIQSCRIGARKPESSCYLQACEALGTQPHRTTLLDDLGINLKPARALGLYTIKVVDPDAAVAELEALLA